MGMFDWIRYTGACPSCGALVDYGWQSKDGPCELGTIEPWQVGSFYATCRSCGAWITATVDAEIEHIVKRCDVHLKVRRRGTQAD